MDRLQSGSISVFNIFALVVFFKFLLLFFCHGKGFGCGRWVRNRGPYLTAATVCDKNTKQKRREERVCCGVVLCNEQCAS